MRAKTRSGFVMASHAVGHDTPYLELFAFEKVPRRVARVFRFEHDLTAVPGKSFARRLAVHSRDHNVPRFSLDGAVDNHQIARVDPGADHAVPFYTHQVDVRSPDVEQLIKRDTLLKVIGCRRGKACRDVKGKERELCAAGFERAEDGDHDENAYTVYMYS